MGSYNRHALSRISFVDRNAEAKIDADWFEGAFSAGHGEPRECVYPNGFYRWAISESDGLPGLIMDRYGDAISVQLNTAGMDKLREPLFEAMDRLADVNTLVLRGDTPQREHEGLGLEVETLRGDGTEIELVENGLPFVTTLTQGQKTGWFYDQRDSRALLASLVSQFEEPKVFDGYCYAGGFAIAMATQGAQVTAVDRSGPALELAQQSATMNEVELNCIKADVFNVLERALCSKQRGLRSGQSGSARFCQIQKVTLRQSLRGYRKLTRMGADITGPGGFLVVHSCSHHVDLNALTEQIARGMADAGRTAQVLFTLGAAASHHNMPQLPESQYLKGLVMRLD